MMTAWEDGAGRVRAMARRLESEDDGAGQTRRELWPLPVRVLVWAGVWVLCVVLLLALAMGLHDVAVWGLTLLHGWVGWP